MKTSNITFSDKRASIFRTASNGFFLAAFFLLKTAPLQAKEAYPHKGDKQENLELLLAGNERFVQNQPQHSHRNHDRLVEVSKDQHPYAPVFSCSDSQVASELVFGQGLGELFIIRNAVNTLSQVELGSVEYALEHLNTQLIIVMGYENCGAIKVVEENAQAEGNLTILLANIK